MQYFETRLDTNYGGAGELLPVEFTVTNFEGVVDVLKFATGDLPANHPGAATQNDYNTYNGAEFLVEVSVVGRSGGFPIPLEPDGIYGCDLPCDPNGDAMTLLVKCYPKNRAYVKIVTHDGCEFKPHK